MLTAVVWGADAPRPLAQTLAALVPAAIDGGLREVAVAGTEAAADARFVADQAGCRVLTGERPALVVAPAKGRWLLIVKSGDRVPEDWLEAALSHDKRSAEAARVAVVGSTAPFWRRWRMQEGSALLVPVARVAGGAEADWSTLARSIRGRRLAAGGRRRD